MKKNKNNFSKDLLITLACALAVFITAYFKL